MSLAFGRARTWCPGSAYTPMALEKDDGAAQSRDEPVFPTSVDSVFHPRVVARREPRAVAQPVSRARALGDRLVEVRRPAPEVQERPLRHREVRVGGVLVVAVSALPELPDDLLDPGFHEC